MWKIKQTITISKYTHGQVVACVFIASLTLYFNMFQHVSMNVLFWYMYVSLKNITSEGKELVGCDRATLFLIDTANQTIWAKVVDGMNAIVLPIGVGIAGQAASGESGTIINIKDAYLDDRFNSR